MVLRIAEQCGARDHVLEFLAIVVVHVKHLTRCKDEHAGVEVLRGRGRVEERCALDPRAALGEPERVQGGYVDGVHYPLSPHRYYYGVGGLSLYPPVTVLGAFADMVDIDTL